MRSASFAAALILARAWFLVRIGTYSGSKSFSMSTPNWLLGRSMTCPFDAITVKPRPRNLESVRDLVGAAPLTSDLPRALAAGLGAIATFASFGALTVFEGLGPLTAFKGCAAGVDFAALATVARAERALAPERPGAAASVSAARARCPPSAFAPRALMSLVEFAMGSFQPSRFVTF